MKRLEEHDIEFYERDDGRIVAKMEDPPVEGHGDDIAEALEDAAYEVRQFADGVSEALLESMKNLNQDRQ